tara:strand:+ start:3598 stop:6240 length:2643 start_codon:yes stop_codon:yes gene_type:complete
MASQGRVKAGEAFIVLRTFDMASKQLDKIAGKLDALSSKAFNTGRNLGVLSVALATPIALSTKELIEFDDVVKQLEALATAEIDINADAAIKSLEELRKQALEVGKATSFTATAVAVAQAELKRRGSTLQDVQEQTPHVVSLGRATKLRQDSDIIAIQKAAKATKSTLNQFNLEAKETQRVVDVIAHTVNNSANDIDTFAESMKFVGPVAKDFGLSLEEAASAIAVLADNGLEGSLAGTSLRRILLALPEKKDIILELTGVDTLDEAKSAFEILDSIGNATLNKMNNRERLAFFKDLFDLRALTSASKLIQNGFGLEQFTAALKNSEGLAKKTQERMDSGIGGATRRLKSAISALAIDKIGGALESQIISLSTALTKLVDSVGDVLEKNPSLVRSFVAITAALGAGSVSLITLGVSLKSAAIALSLFSGILGIPATLVGLLTSKLIAVPAAIAALSIVLLDATNNLDKFKTNAGEAIESIANVTKINEFGSSIKSMINSVVTASKSGMATISNTIESAFKAIAAQDFEGLAEVLKAGLELAARRATKPFIDQFNLLKDTVFNTLIDIQEKIKSIFARISDSISEFIFKMTSLPSSGIELESEFNTVFRMEKEAEERQTKIKEEATRSREQREVEVEIRDRKARNRLEKLRNKIRSLNKSFDFKIEQPKRIEETKKLLQTLDIKIDIPKTELELLIKKLDKKGITGQKAVTAIRTVQESKNIIRSEREKQERIELAEKQTIREFQVPKDRQIDKETGEVITTGGNKQFVGEDIQQIFQITNPEIEKLRQSKSGVGRSLKEFGLNPGSAETRKDPFVETKSVTNSIVSGIEHGSVQAKQTTAEARKTNNHLAKIVGKETEQTALLEGILDAVSTPSEEILIG